MNNDIHYYFEYDIFLWLSNQFLIFFVSAYHFLEFGMICKYLCKLHVVIVQTADAPGSWAGEKKVEPKQFIWSQPEPFLSKAGQMIDQPN